MRPSDLDGHAFPLARGEVDVEVRVLVDRSVAEIFVQKGRTVRTGWDCSKGADAAIVNTGSVGVKLLQLDAYHGLQTANVQPSPKLYNSLGPHIA